MKNCIHNVIIILFFCLVAWSDDMQDDFSEKFTVAGSSDSYEITMRIPSSLQKSKVGKNPFESKDGKIWVYISFLMSPKPITKDELMKLANIYSSLSIIKEKIVEVKGNNYYGYSLITQNEGLKTMSRYETTSKIFFKNSFLVNISIMSNRKDESELLGELYSSIENAKIEKLSEKNKVREDQGSRGQAPAIDK
jgi:hypothetical protein